MAQITNGIRALLSRPSIYSLFQNIMGARSGRIELVNDFIRPKDGMNVLDIGCGPAEILDHLPGVNYWGFDISESYIQRAKERYGEKGSFQNKLFKAEDLNNLPKFDIVLASGLLHHLDDPEVQELIYLSNLALKNGGRLITIDPCFEEGQNPIARFVISRDRGQNVRTRDEYSALVKNTYTDPRVEIRHKIWIPYTHCIMECIKNDSV